MSCGPLRVPATYDVVRSSGTGRMTTRAFSKSVVVGVVPPYSPTATRSYSNGRFIHSLEVIGRNGLAVNRHDARRQGEDGRPAPRQNRRRRGRERRRQNRQRDRAVGLNAHLRRIGGELAPALRLL